MHGDFWRERWSEGKIGFHEARGNAYLAQFGAHLDGVQRVLVPLCGKSIDLGGLAARGHEVVGVELVEDAVRAFFAEAGLTPVITPEGTGPVTRYAAAGITIFAGDFFAMTPAMLGEIDGIYDRAAMVALPADMRGRYVARLRELAAPGAKVLLVTYEYPDGARQGPPFSILRTEVQESYAGAAAIDEVADGPDPRFPDDPAFRERCFTITL